MRSRSLIAGVALLAVASVAAAGPSGPVASVAVAAPSDPVPYLFRDEFTVPDRAPTDLFGGYRGGVDAMKDVTVIAAMNDDTPVADREFSTWQQLTYVVVRALDNATVGDSGGLLTVIEDDPAPNVTISPATTRVTEGDVVTWTITMSRPIADFVVFYGAFTPPTTGPELSGADVTERQRID